MFGYYCMRGINFLNVLLAAITNYSIQILNPYTTEIQTQILNRELYNVYSSRLDLLYAKGFFNKEFLEMYKRKNYRSSATPLKYSIIGLGTCIQQVMGD